MTVVLGMVAHEVAYLMVAYLIAIGSAIFFYFYIDIYKRVSGDLDQEHEETQKLLGVNNFWDVHNTNTI